MAGWPRSSARGIAAVLAGALLVACASAGPPRPNGAGGSDETSAPPGALAAPAAAIPEPPREHLRLIHPVASLGHGHMAVAQAAGYYAEQGLDVELQYMAGATLVVSALIAGEAELASLTAGPVIAADLQGADLVTIAEPVSRLTLTLFAVPEIQTPEALRGKRMGVVIPGGVTDMAARQSLRHLGLDADQDMTFVRTGGMPETYTAMLAGAVDAGMLGHPVTVQARRNGMQELLDMSTLDLEYPTAAVVTSQRVLAQREATLLRFLRATGQAIHRLKTDKEFTLTVMARFTDTDDREVLEEGYRTTAPLFRDVPVPTRAGTLALMEEVAYTQPAVREAAPERFYEPRLVQQLEAEGFFRQVWGR